MKKWNKERFATIWEKLESMIALRSLRARIFLLTLVMMRRVFQNLQAEEHAAMLLQHHRASEPYMAENVPENPETT